LFVSQKLTAPYFSVLTIHTHHQNVQEAAIICKFDVTHTFSNFHVL